MEVLALVVVIVLLLLIVGVTRWGRGGAAYDDGTGSAYLPYVPEPRDEQRGAEPAARPDPEAGEDPGTNDRP